MTRLRSSLVLPEGDAMIEQGIDTDLLTRFEHGLNPKDPDKSLIPAKSSGMER